MKRRGFMGSVAGLAIGATVGPWVACARAGEMEAVVLANRLLQAYPKHRSLAAIGDAFLQDDIDHRMACRPCLPDMMQDFLRDLDIDGRHLRGMPPAKLRARIEARTARDFSSGKIVQVRGWLLAETEARLCTIAALRAA